MKTTVYLPEDLKRRLTELARVRETSEAALILCDASAVLAVLDGRERFHRAAREALDRELGPFVLSPFVCAEIDHLVRRSAGIDAELAFLATVSDDFFTLARFDALDVVRAIGVIEQYPDLGIGLADASIVVLAERTRRAASSRSTAPTSARCGRSRAASSSCCPRRSRRGPAQSLASARRAPTVQRSRGRIANGSNR